MLWGTEVDPVIFGIAHLGLGAHHHRPAALSG
jgi:hypothetical protein